MRILVLSDLHLEFASWDHQKGFIASLDPEGVDVVILAGDICLYKQTVEAMTLICQRFENAQVVWVHGNHEFYTSDRATVVERSLAAVQQNKNLHWLDNSAVTIGGQRFVGTPMWFPWNDINPQIEFFMNDFRVIKDYRKWVYAENQHAVSYIMGNVDQNDIVVSHHLPSAQSIAPRYSKSELNNFFLCDMEDFIKQRGPKIWVHGHTHDSFDYEIPHTATTHKTRVICNPRGYFPHDLNPDFNRALVIDV